MHFENENETSKDFKTESSLFPFTCSLRPLPMTVATCVDQKHVLKESTLQRPINTRGKVKFDLFEEK